MQLRLRTHKRPARKGNPARRRHRQMPAVALAEIETRLYSMLSPESFKPLKEVGVEGRRKRRSRLLSLPVMMAIPSTPKDLLRLVGNQRTKISKRYG